jgi:predicted RNase H-like HicB family nuclease
VGVSGIYILVVPNIWANASGIQVDVYDPITGAVHRSRARDGRREARRRPRAGDVEQRFEAGRIEAMKYLIVIEQTATGYSAYSPDLPGCIATGSTRDEVEREMKGAIAFHLDGLKAEGMAIPQPSSSSSYVEVPA